MATHGIWIPIAVLKNKDLSSNEKYILCEIMQLSSLEKGCIASNKHFAEFLDIKPHSVSKIISNLSKKKYITVTLMDRNMRREITMLSAGLTMLSLEHTPALTGAETKEKKTINNNIGDVERVIKYLNTRAEASYKASGKLNIKVIAARIKEGHDLKDFAHVVDVKVREWKGTDMEKFLRPETLFGNKFDGYLQQKKVQSNKQEAEGVQYTW